MKLLYRCLLLASLCLFCPAGVAAATAASPTAKDNDEQEKTTTTTMMMTGTGTGTGTGTAAAAAATPPTTLNSILAPPTIPNHHQQSVYTNPTTSSTNHVLKYRYPVTMPSAHREEKGNQVHVHVDTSSGTMIKSQDASNELSSNNEVRIKSIQESIVSLGFESNIHQTSIAERAVVLKQLYNYLQEVSSMIPSIDLSTLPYPGNAVPLEKVAKEAIERLADLIDFMESMSETKNTQEIPYHHTTPKSIAQSPQDHDLIHTTKEVHEITAQGRRRATTAFNDDTNNKKRERSAQFNPNESTFKQHYKDFHHRATTYTNKYEHFYNIQEAILHGDHSTVDNILSSFQQSHGFPARGHDGGSGDKHGRRMNFGSTENFKLNQCKLLVNCTKNMNLYDLVVFFFADDIDPSAGKVDESIFLFDEKEILMKRDTIGFITDKLDFIFVETPENATLQDVEGDCNRLLSQFHRSVELEKDISQWHGATVSEVCLAQGTATYLKLEDVATKLDPLIDNWTIQFEDFPFYPLTLPTNAQIKSTMTFGSVFEILTVAVDCSTHLFNSQDRRVSDNGVHANEMEIFMDPATFFQFPVGIDPNRSAHGQLDSNVKPAFILKLFNSIENEIISNISTKLKKIVDDCNKNDEECINNFNKLEDKYKEPRDIILQGRGDLYKQIDKAFQLVFGPKPSLGLICGLANLVQKPGGSLPGTCCLDAPFQLGEEDWGLQYSCEVKDMTTGNMVPNECKSFAPYYGKVGKESCEVYGGTFCPNTNCTILRQCIKEFIDCGQEENRGAFVAFLQNAPNITDPTSSIQCGTTREYFGYPQNFANDDRVCENIEELRNSRDFEFLQEFFNQGSKGGPGDDGIGGDADARIPPILLEVPPPENGIDQDAGSKKPEVQNGKAWASRNFALKMSQQGAEDIVDIITKVECPEDPTGAVKSTCATGKNIAFAIARGTFTGLRVAYEMSQFTYEQQATFGGVKAFQTAERVETIFDNMKITGEYLQTNFQTVVNFIGKRLDKIQDPTRSAVSSSRSASRSLQANNQTCIPGEECPVDFQVAFGVGCDALDQDGILGDDNCEEDLFAPYVNLKSSVAASTAACVVDYCFDAYFGNETHARTYLGAVFQAIDDCANFEDVKMEISKVTDNVCGGSGAQTQFKITPVQTFPENSNCSEMILRGRSITVQLGLDEKPPVVSCGFSSPDNDSQISDDGKLIIIPDKQGTLFVDTNLFYSIEKEKCRSIVDVSVSVSSNEFVHGSEIAVLTNVENVRGPTQAELFVTPQSCASGSQRNATICKKDPSVNFRFYEVNVSAVDSAGNTAVDTCFVIIDTEANDPDDDDMPSDDPIAGKGMSRSSHQKGKGGKSKRGLLDYSRGGISEDLLAPSTVRYKLATVSSVAVV